MDRKETRVLPFGVYSGTFIYAAARADGVIKIGVTRNARIRMQTLFDDFRREGTAMTGAYLVKTHKKATEAENEALRLMRSMHGEPCRGKEWFANACPKQAVVILHQAA